MIKYLYFKVKYKSLQTERLVKIQHQILSTKISYMANIYISRMQ